MVLERIWVLWMGRGEKERVIKRGSHILLNNKIFDLKN